MIRPVRKRPRVRGRLGRLLLIVVALVTAVGAANVSGAGLGIAGPAGAQDQPAQEKVALAIESRVDDVSTDELSLITMSTLTDPRGWAQAASRSTPTPTAPTGWSWPNPTSSMSCVPPSRPVEP